jgi:N-methylhydantoinase A
LRRTISTELKKEDWPGRTVYEPSADLRYRGQGYEINLPYGDDVLERFHAEHKKRYGYSSPEREVEIVTLRVRGRVASPEKLPAMRMKRDAKGLKASDLAAYFAGKSVRTKVVPRNTLAAGRRYRGPAIITEYSATAVIPPGLTFRVDRIGNLLVEVDPG